jgi:hypothetical protein
MMDMAGEQTATILIAWNDLFKIIAAQMIGGPLRANIDETLPAVIITEQGGKENHRERGKECHSFRSQFG